MAKKITCEIYANDTNESTTPLINEILSDIRLQDLEDLKASGNDPAFILVASIRLSDELRIYRGEDGKLLCLWGKAAPSWNAPGRQMWMIGTNELYNGYVKSVLFIEARKVLKEWIKQHGILHNVVYEGNKTSVKYLSRLGAHWCPEAIINNGKRFFEFYMTEVK